MADNVAEYCTICRQPAASAWHGEESTIAVCSVCALDVLPKLIGDALDLAHARPDDRARAMVRRVESNLWKALALRLLKGSK
jgi:hypothetical protein